MILSSRLTIPSCKLLRSAIEDLTGVHLMITSNTSLIKNCTIRYGNSQIVRGKDTEFNSKNFIELCSNKLTYSNFLKDNGIATVEFLNADCRPDHYPVLIRTTLTSYGGRGIIPIRTEEEFLNTIRENYHWSPYLPFSKEYRVHILGSSISRVFSKVLEEETDIPIRNNASCHFSLKNIEDSFGKLKELVNSVANVLEKDGFKGFYALDVGFNSADKQYYVIESNTAPGLNENTAVEYAKYLVEEKVLEV